MFMPYVLIFLQKHNEVLLIQRSKTSSYGAGFYSLPGGKIEDNETARQAAIREAYEELDITIAKKDLDFVHVFHRNGEGESIFALVFKVTRWQGEIINKEPEKHDMVRWFAITQLPDNLLPAHRQAIENIIKDSHYSEHGW